MTSIERQLAEALELLLKKGSKWHPCDAHVMSARAALDDYYQQKQRSMVESSEEKRDRNFRVQFRYDQLMNEGKHGHYETMFAVVREEVERVRRGMA